MATSVTPEFVFGQKDVTAAGTAEKLDATEYRIKSLLIIAKAANTGQVFYGDSDVDSSTQVGLDAGDSVMIEGDKPFALGTIYVDVGVSGEGVDFVAVRA